MDYEVRNVYDRFYDDHSKQKNAKLLGRFQVIEQIEEGGWTELFIGRNTDTGEICLIRGYEVCYFNSGIRAVSLMSMCYWTIEGIGLNVDEVAPYLNKEKVIQLLIEQLCNEPDIVADLNQMLTSGDFSGFDIDDYLYGSPFENFADLLTHCDDTDSITYVTPPSIASHNEASAIYDDLMRYIAASLQKLDALDIPREDSALGLPLGMETKMVDKRNLRNLIDMSHQRMCTRAYHEYRGLFSDYRAALSEYSDEWKYIVDHYLMPKCRYMGFCKERYTCGLMPRRGDLI